MPVVIWLADPGHRAAEISRHVELGDALQVADRAVNDEAGSGLLPDVEGQVVTDDAAQIETAAGVDHKHIAGLQHIQGGLMTELDHVPFLLPL